MRDALADRLYDTYGIVSPRATHTRPARCEEVEAHCTSEVEPGVFCAERHCGPWAHGWKTLLDTSIPQQRDLARLVVKNDGNRRWTASQNGHLVEFTFPSGQQCFAGHRVPIDRPPIFTLKRGREYRVDPGHHLIDGAVYIPGTRNVRGEEWIERFGENQQALADAQQKG